MTKLRLYFAGGIVAGLALLAWTVRAWWRRSRRERALLELRLASEGWRPFAPDASRRLDAAQAADRIAKRLLTEADAEVAKRRPKVITAESVEERMQDRP